MGSAGARCTDKHYTCVPPHGCMHGQGALVVYNVQHVFIQAALGTQNVPCVAHCSYRSTRLAGALAHACPRGTRARCTAGNHFMAAARTVLLSCLCLHGCAVAVTATSSETSAVLPAAQSDCGWCCHDSCQPGHLGQLRQTTASARLPCLHAQGMCIFTGCNLNQA